MIVGGHTDKPKVVTALWGLLETTLRRELDEELSIRQIEELRPLGIVVDASSSLASLHVAFLYDALVSEIGDIQAKEEFSLRSKFSGKFYTAEEIVGLRSRPDPWSRIIIEDILKPRGLRKVPRQPELIAAQGLDSY